MSGRTPEQILEEFGQQLRTVRPRRWRWRWGVAALLATTLVVPAAVATKPVWAPEPNAVRPVGAREPDAATRMSYVAQGAGWRLARSSCRFEDGGTTVVVYLRTDSGGAGRRCDALPPHAASGPVMAPMVQIDPDTHQALLFGAVPHGITVVQAQLHRPGNTTTELQTIPVKDDVFVARIPRDARVLNTVGLTDAGEPRLRCDNRSCKETR